MYPFRFFGRECSDWDDGAEDGGYYFSLRFQRTPNPQERAQLATRFESSLAVGNASPCSAWLWSGPSVLLSVGHRWNSRGRHVESVAKYLRSAHRIVPLVDVVYHNAHDGIGPWHAWSSQHSPLPGPELGLPGHFQRPLDPSAEPLAMDPSFESIREQWRADQAQAELDALCAPPKRGKVGLARPRVEVPADEYRTEASALELGERDVLSNHAWTLPTGYTKGQFGGVDDIFWFVDGRRCSPQWRRPSVPQIGDLSQDGSTLAVWTRKEAHLVDVASGAVRTIHTPAMDDGFGLEGVGFLAGAVAVLAQEKLYAYDVTADPPTVLDTAKVKGSSLRVFAAGECLFLHDYGSRPRVFAWTGAELKAIGTFKAEGLEFHAERGGTAFLRHEPTGSVYELTHVSAALEAIAPRRGKAKRPAVEARPVTGVPPGTGPETATRGDRRAWLHQAGSGHTALRTGYLSIGYSDGTAEVDLTAAFVDGLTIETPLSTIAFAPLGDTLLLQGRYRIHSFDLNTQTRGVGWVPDYQTHGQLLGFGVLPDGRLVVLSQTGLHLVKDGEVLDSVKVVKPARMAFASVIDTAVVITESKHQAVAYTVTAKGRLKKVAQVLGESRLAHVRGERVYLSGFHHDKAPRLLHGLAAAARKAR